MHRQTVGDHMATAPTGECSPRAAPEGGRAEIPVEQGDRLQGQAVLLGEAAWLKVGPRSEDGPEQFAHGQR